MKEKKKIARRVNNSLNQNVAEQLKIYLKSLSLNKIEEVENDFRINANSMTRIREMARTLELFYPSSFFYYLTG